MVTFSETGAAIFIKAISNNLQLSRGMPKLNSVWLVRDCRYALYCLEEEFSETGFPAYGILGNSEGVRAKERARV